MPPSGPTPDDRSLLLGVDAGGTKTHAVLATEDGSLLAEATSGPGNPLSVGDEAALASLQDAVNRVLAGAVGSDLQRAHFGVAGAGRPPDAERVGRLVNRVGLPCPVGVSDDARTTFHAGASPPGVVLVCGTGSIAVAYTEDGEEYLAGGHGYLLGDEGSGYWIGREAVRAALRAADGRGEPTALRSSVPESLGRSSLDTAVTEIYSGQLGRPEIAGLAASVLGLEDNAARSIREAAATELVLAVTAAVSASGIEGTELRLVLAGGLLQENSPLLWEVSGNLRHEFPRARIHAGCRAPALGAVRLAAGVLEGSLRSPETTTTDR